MQINVGRSISAHDMAMIVAHKYNIDLIAISEPNKNKCKGRHCYTNGTKDVMIQNFSKKYDLINYKSIGTGAVRIELTDIIVYNVYLSPNTCSLPEFENQLYSIQADMIQMPKNKRLILTGDFNAKHPTWGGTLTNRKGACLLEWVTSLDLNILNDGRKPTCVRHNGSSYIDVTFVNEKAFPQSTWERLEHESMSDHCYTITRLKSIKRQKCYYVYGATNYELLNSVFTENALTLCVESCEKAIETAYKKSTPKVRSEPGGKLPYWWSQTIQTQIQEVKRARKSYQRNKAMDKREALLIKYKGLKGHLKKSIAQAKRKVWEELCNKLEENAFGDAYKIVKD
jgi:hypothetical protein